MAGSRMSNRTDMKVLVVVHKPYWVPSNSLYQPIQVGFAPEIDPGFLRDNAGDNIADRNAFFCELTALYWAWKNDTSDVLGLCHYRRYLGDNRFWEKKKDRILNEKQVRSFLAPVDIILPKKRRYWIETRESQYAHAHHIEDLWTTEAVLLEKYPDYVPAWKHMLGTRSGHICNMFVMRRELLDEYCTWLFDILFEVEKRLDISSYSENDSRVFGFLGERLLDVWVETKRLRYVEVPMINLERQHWLKKGTSFIKRKINGEKAIEKKD